MNRATPPLPEHSSTFALPAALVALAVLVILLALGARPPSPRPVTAAANEFSAGRAIEVLERLLAEGVPHPVGSPANRVVRDRILDEFTALGYEPHVQRAFSCRAAGGSCAWVENIAVRVPGRGDPPAVSPTGDPVEGAARAIMLASHYDSRGAGPGAADAGAGVAALLEVARIIRLEGPYRNPVILLLTDGEEAGLLGAEAFVRDHPWASEVGVAINLEARGSGGPSIMFETSDNNRWLISAYSRASRRAVASSLSYDVYRLMPNDTDATVFRRAGMDVLNFAFIDGVVHYHSALDDLEHLDPRSVQHHGENALASLRAFAATALQPRPGDATYMDVFGIAIIHWPTTWTLPAAIVFLLMLSGALALWLSRGAVRLAQVGWALLATALALAAAAAAGWAAGGLLGAVTGRPGGAHAYAWLAWTALWAGALAIVLGCATLVAGRAGFRALLIAPWLFISVLTIALAASLPGAAVVLIVPQAVAAFAVALAVYGHTSTRVKPQTAAFIAVLGAGFTLLPLARMLHSTFVLYMPVAITAVVALAALPLMPFMAAAPGDRSGSLVRRGITGGAAAMALLALTAALLVPGYSERSPQPLNIMYLEDSAGGAFWSVQGVAEAAQIPQPLRDAAAFTHSAPTWAPPTARGPSAPTAALGLPAPRLEVLADHLSDDGRVVAIRVHTAHSGNRLLVVIPGSPLVRVEGQGVVGWRPATNSHAILLHGVPAEGIVMEMAFRDRTAKTVLLFDHTPGLPPEGATLRAARPRTAAPIGDGDVSVVRAGVTL
jgi:hypothetical protein